MNNKIQLVLKIIVALILVQTLRYKFTAHPDSVYIFSKLGLEPYGRIGIGILELITSVLLFIPKTVWVGALLALGVISGALFSHLTKLGIEINDDGGKVFYMAVIVFVLSAIILLNNRKSIPFIGKTL